MTDDGRTEGQLERRLAEFVLRTRWDDIPADVAQRSVNLLLDALACAASGRHASDRKTFVRIAKQIAGEGDSMIVGGGTGSPAAAALSNGWQTTATTMCDVYRPRMCHVTPVVLPALLAGWDKGHRDLHESLVAFTVGVELTVRLCNALPAESLQGDRWHAPGVVGPFGGVATLGRLVSMDTVGLQRAWGTALLQSSGTFSAIGSPGVKFTQARAAMAAVIAVEFTRAGHGGTECAFTHADGGLYDAYGGESADAAKDLGVRWSLLDIAQRRWPASSSLQAVIEGLLSIRSRIPDPDTSGTEIEVWLPSPGYRLGGRMPWSTPLSSLQSASWVAASVWLDNRCWTDQFDEAAIADPTKSGFAAERVRVFEDPSLPTGAARVRVGAGDHTAETEIVTATGDPACPLSADDIDAKLAMSMTSKAAEYISRTVRGGAEGPTSDLTPLIGLIGSTQG